jgi:hypothetical protein
MNKRLTKKDYIKILTYYKLSIPGTMDALAAKAEKIMAQKLCRCIQKLQPSKGSRAVGICTGSIFKRKGFTRGAFKCRKRQTVKMRRRV